MLRSLSRKIVVLVAVTAAASAVSGGRAAAGVILHEQDTVTGIERHPPPLDRIIEIEGLKKKVSDKYRVHDFVVDLANNQTLIIHPRSKDYFVLPFPPKPGTTAQWMVLPFATPPLISYKATGKSSKILGYACREFSGDGYFNNTRYSVQGCFSTTAPGADIYSAFTKKAAGLLGSLAPAGINFPDGVPLSMKITQKAIKAPPPTISPSNNKPTPTPVPKPGDWVEVETTNMIVTSIQLSKGPIPDEEFVPKGFEAKRPNNLGF